MLTKRIIPCLDVDAGRVVKGVSFIEIRDAGDPVQLASYYDAEGADELVLPPPHLPITKNAALFNDVADHGARLIYLHAYGQRFAQPGDGGFMPEGEARCIKAVPYDQYPPDFGYDPNKRILYVGDGEFAPVEPEVWDYSVSGLQIVKS